MPKLIRFLLKSASLHLAALVLIVPANATTIVIDIKADRILVLADSRAGDVGVSDSVVRDDKCKIAILGKEIAFAGTGNEGYTPFGAGDNVPEWHAITEAINAYNNTAGHDPYAVASAWSAQVMDKFQSFYRINPERVRSLAVKGLLVIGLFAGKGGDGNLKVYLGRVVLDDVLQARAGAPTPIGYAVDAVPMSDEPVSTNNVTEELLEGKTDRAKQVANLWEEKSSSVPPEEQRLQWLEYLVERTADYDPDVHSPVHVVEVGKGGAAWVRNSACSTQ